MHQTSTVPTVFDLFTTSGDPDLESASPGSGPLGSTTEDVNYAPAGGRVTAGLWSSGPSEVGPFDQPAPAGSATDTATATIQAFDPAAAPASGDLWQTSVNPSAAFTPVTINPGQSATINLVITPSAASGTVVAGPCTSTTPPPMSRRSTS